VKRYSQSIENIKTKLSPQNIKSILLLIQFKQMSSEEKIEAKAEPTAKEELKDAHNNTEDTKVSTPVAAETETDADKELVTSESKLSTSNDDEKKRRTK